MSKHPTFTLDLRPFRSASLAAAALLCVMAAGPAQPQTMTNSFGQLSKNSGEPIDIESDVLVVHDAKKYATFKGNVKAVQGSTTLRANELDVHYVGGGGDSLTGGAPAKTEVKAGESKKPAAGGALGDGAAPISKIEARGEVIITSDKDQTTTSDWALYDVPSQLVTVGGDVVLMQGKNVLKGDQLVIDLKTGESRFENKGDPVAGGGRIRALFMPNQDAKPGDAKTADDNSEDDKSDKDKSGNDASNKPKAGNKGAANDKAAGNQADDTGSAPLPILPDERR